MATISGKRFQITDGASTPTNLFPYTVTEAVYGLSTVIENAKTAVTSVLSAVTLNGVSKAGTTASFYAPTTAGTTGQILKATTSGAPVWTSAALGASNKPVYLNSSGVLTEGVSCLPLTGGTLSNAAWGEALIINSAAAGGESAIKFTSNGTLVGVIGVKAAMTPVFYPGNETSGSGYTIYHSGNSNKSDVAWTASGFFTPNHGTHLTVGPTTWTYRTVLSSSWTSATGDYLDIGVPSSGSGNPSVIRLLGSGNVGIGTTSPSCKLDVSGSSGWTGRFAGTSAGVWIANSDGPGIYIGSKATSGSALIDARYGQTTLGSGGTSALYVRADGRVGIGTTSPGNTLEVNGSATCGASGVAGSIFIRRAYDGNTTYMIGSKGASGADAYTLQISNSSGTGATMTLLNGVLTMSGSIVSTGDQVVSSDLTLKENLTPVTYSVSDIAKARAVEFDWKDGRGHSMGSIAQDWLGIAPALVHGDEGNMSLAYGQLALVNTILLARQSESHEERIKELEARVAELEMENERLRMN